jgi:nucleotide-binding universal stress UspA family protein
MTISKILIGIDDSKFAEHAAEYGFDLARKFNAAVGLVNIVEPVILPESSTSIDPLMSTAFQSTSIEEMDLLNIQKSQSENVVERTIKKLGEGVLVTQFSEYGSTADGIISCSKEFGADLIVIGTHNRSGLDRWLLGSIAEDVVRQSEIPVLVVPFSS